MRRIPEHHADPTNPRPSRRAVLAAGAGLAAAMSASSIAAPRVPSLSTSARPSSNSAKPRNVIFMVSDGMSLGTLTLADELHRLLHDDEPSRWRRLWDRADTRRALQRTTSANAIVTDSAAAGSAWGICEKVNNGSVNITVHGSSPEPILVRAKAAGRATGLVTTTRLTHATPAAFIANVPRRSMEDDIARQMIERGVDVALGGGRRHFPRELLESRPHRVVRTTADLQAARPDETPLLGLFHTDHMHYELDRRAVAPETEPSLAQMSRVALRHLEAKDRPFILQIEGGRVDHGGHGNDASALLYDQLAFDEAVGAVEDWCEGRDDTLVIVTSDHGNANPGSTFYGERGLEGFAHATRFTRTFDWIFDQLKPLEGTRRLADGIIEHVRTATSVTLLEEEAGFVARAMSGERINSFRLANGSWSVLASVLANHTGIAFLSPNHTSDLVEVTAFGTGAGDMPAYVDNTQLGDWLRTIAAEPITARRAR